MSYSYDTTHDSLSLQIINRLDRNSWIQVDSTDEHFLTESVWSNSNGYAKRYREKKVNGKRIRRVEYLHRLILITKPSEVVDHINRDPSDNRRSNLRAVNKSINALNKPTRVGASRVGSSDRWFTRIKYNKKAEHIGTFGTKEEAVSAYEKRKEELLNEL